MSIVSFLNNAQGNIENGRESLNKPISLAEVGASISAAATVAWERELIKRNEAMLLTYKQRKDLAGRLRAFGGTDMEGFIQFLEWMKTSQSLKNSAWWQFVNGSMMIDMREALEIEERDGLGNAHSDNPTVQAWIDYMKAIKSGKNPLEAFWYAHQLSIHTAMDNAGALYAQEPPGEREFIDQTVVQNVDLSALLNIPSSGLMAVGMNIYIGGLSIPGLPPLPPFPNIWEGYGTYPSSGIDKKDNLLTWINAYNRIVKLAPPGLLPPIHLPPPGSLGVNSNLWKTGNPPPSPIIDVESNSLLKALQALSKATGGIGNEVAEAFRETADAKGALDIAKEIGEGTVEVAVKIAATGTGWIPGTRW